MDRFVRGMLQAVPPDLLQVSEQAQLDLRALLRFRPLSALFRFARRHRRWSMALAAKSTGAPLKLIRALEGARLENLEPAAVVRYATRLGTVHLLGEWVSANPALARTLQLPGEALLLAQAQSILAEDARHQCLLPDARQRLMPPRFEAPLEFAAVLAPRHGAWMAKGMSVTSPFAPGATGGLSPASDSPGSSGTDGPSVSAPATLEIKVSLRGFRPTIWRRIRVTNDLTFARFHEVLQRVMGWRGQHLHEFRLGDLSIGRPDPEWPHPLVDERRFRLADAGLGRSSELTYVYDFGDDWVHTVRLEKVLPFESAAAPVCLGGALACPPEDSGGPEGYRRLLLRLADQDDPEHGDVRDWVGEDFDPGHFHLPDANAALENLAQEWHRPARRRKTP